MPARRGRRSGDGDGCFPSIRSPRLGVLWSDSVFETGGHHERVGGRGRTRRQQSAGGRILARGRERCTFRQKRRGDGPALLLLRPCRRGRPIVLAMEAREVERRRLLAFAPRFCVPFLFFLPFPPPSSGSPPPCEAIAINRALTLCAVLCGSLAVCVSCLASCVSCRPSLVSRVELG